MAAKEDEERRRKIFRRVERHEIEFEEELAAPGYLILSFAPEKKKQTQH